MRIIHCADLHLGRRRLDGRLPDTDFAVALGHIVSRAVEWKAHAFLIAGDLFDTPQIPPPVLRQAANVLAPLKKARIPVVAVEGNHDRPGSGASPTWVRYLAEEGLLKLLTIPFTSEGPQVKPFDPQTGQGGYWEHSGIRFVGAGYLGAGTERKTAAIVQALPADTMPTVMLLHAGPEYFVGEGGGFSKETLELLRGKAAYLALGHIHRPMIYNDEGGRPWAINPGSPENCRLDEAEIKGPRGWVELDLEPNALPGLALLHAEVKDCPRRPVVRMDIDVTPFGNKLKEGPEAIVAAAVKLLEQKKVGGDAVVRLFLTGELNIGRVAIEPTSMGTAIAAQARVTGVEVELADLKLFTGRPGEKRAADNQTNAEIEHQALEELLRERPPEGLEDRRAETVELYVKLKDAIARRAGPEAILELIENSKLPAAVAKELERSLL